MQKRTRGMTLIDVLVGTALIVLIFLSLMSVLRASILVARLAQARAGASSLAESQMEYLRGLSYDSLGTVGGIPSGTVPQDATTTMDGTTYVTHTYIQYIDDPADGLGVNDTNGITTDYKLAKVEVSYVAGGKTRTAMLISNFAPPGIETTSGGGTLAVHVVDATGADVPGATVHIIDASTTPAVDFSTFANSTGMVYLPGAATSTQYQVFVSDSGYSSAQTYPRTATNQNPTPGYLTVVQNQTTTGTFAIGLLASLTMRTYAPVTGGAFSDAFTSTADLATTTDTVVSGGALTLASSTLSGSARSIAVAPSHLDTWTDVQVSTSTPAGTSALVHVYDTTTGTLVPDTVLPGNAAGFATSSIDLSSVSTTTYPSLALTADLSSNSTSTAPEILNWSLGYQAGPTPLPDVPFTLTGTKTIGSTGSGAPIYKTAVSTTTDSSGARTLSLEWDAYTPTISGYDVEDACPAPPYVLGAGSTNTATLTLGSKTTNRLLVSVQDASGNPLSGVSVTLSRSGYSKTVTTSSCSNAYFGALANDSDYTVTISKTGYTTTSFSGVSVNGQTFYAAAFP